MVGPENKIGAKNKVGPKNKVETEKRFLGLPCIRMHARAITCIRDASVYTHMPLYTILYTQYLRT